MGFPGSASGKEPTCQCKDLRDTSSIPGWGRSPEKEMATHSRIPAWRIPWTEEPWGGTEEPWGGPAGEGGHSPQGRKESDATEH